MLRRLHSALLKIKIGTGYDVLASFWSENPESDFAAAERSVREGLAGDPPAFAKGIAHMVLADAALYLKGDFDGAMKERSIALQLLPGDPFPLVVLAYIPVASGDPDTTIAALAELTPQDPVALIGYASLSWAYFAKKDYKKAIEVANADPVPTPTFSMLFLAASYAALGRTEEAQKVGKDILAAAPWATVKIFRTSYRMRDQEVFDRWAAALRTAGIPEG